MSKPHASLSPQKDTYWVFGNLEVTVRVPVAIITRLGSPQEAAVTIQGHKQTSQEQIQKMLDRLKIDERELKLNPHSLEVTPSEENPSNQLLVYTPRTHNQ